VGSLVAHIKRSKLPRQVNSATVEEEEKLEVGWSYILSADWRPMLEKNSVHTKFRLKEKISQKKKKMGKLPLKY
jgi:hypothetical protein